MCVAYGCRIVGCKRGKVQPDKQGSAAELTEWMATAAASNDGGPEATSATHTKEPVATTRKRPVLMQRRPATTFSATLPIQTSNVAGVFVQYRRMNTTASCLCHAIGEPASGELLHSSSDMAMMNFKYL